MVRGSNHPFFLILTILSPLPQNVLLSSCRYSSHVSLCSRHSLLVSIMQIPAVIAWSYGKEQIVSSAKDLYLKFSIELCSTVKVTRMVN